LKWPWVAVAQAEVLVVVHQVVQTERARQVSQVAEAVTQDHNLIQVQEVAEVEPQQYT
tara:strand:+ start:159 stop:332 length:174 start_codon:yes stop_codon:yes gene_type:complete